MLTNDRNTMVSFAYKRVARGDAMPGVIATTNEQSISGAIEDILLITRYMSEVEIREQIVIFLPFRG